jgi:hypothetical protein
MYIEKVKKVLFGKRKIIRGQRVWRRLRIWKSI